MVTILIKEGILIWRKLFIVFLVAIGGFMRSITIDSLGEQGNKIMHVVAGLSMTIAFILLFIETRKS